MAIDANNENEQIEDAQYESENVERTENMQSTETKKDT